MMEMEGGCDSAASVADATSAATNTDGSTQAYSISSVTPKPLQNFNQAVIQNGTVVTPYKYHKCVVIPEEVENQENVDPKYISSPENLQQMITLSSSLGTPSSGQNNTSTTSSFQSPIITPKFSNNEDVSEGHDSSPFAYPLIWEHHHPAAHNSMLLTVARSPRTHRTPNYPSPAKALVYGDSPNQEPLSTYKGNTRTPSKCTKSPSERPIFLTPSSRFTRLGATPSRRHAYNPFDADIDELHLPVVSPSLFKDVVSPSQKVDENFHWSIDQLAVLKPAPIDTSPLMQQELYIDAAHCDKKAQEGIEKFFRATNIVPSPWPSSSSSSSHRPVNLLHQLGTPALASATKSKPTGQSVWCQTEITLPPVLPPEVEAALKPFCTFTQDQWWQGEDEENSMLNNTTLRRKLLFGQEEERAASSSPIVVEVCEVSSDSLDESCSKIFSPVCSDEVDKAELMWCASPVACGGTALPNGFGRSGSPDGFGPAHMLEDLSPVNKPDAPDLSPIRPELPNLSPIQDSEKRKSLKHISPLSSVRTSPITVPANRDKSEIRKCISPGLSPVQHYEFNSSKNNNSLLMKTNNTSTHEVCGVYRLQRCSTSTSPNRFKQKSPACRAVLNEEKCRSPLGSSSMYSGSNSSSMMHTTCTSLSSSNSINSSSMVGINPVISSSSSNSSALCSSAASSLYYTPREWQSNAWSLEEVKEKTRVDSPDVPPPQTVTPQSNPHSTGSGHFSSSPIRNLSCLSPSDSQSPPILSPGGKFAASPPVSPILCRSLMGQSTAQVNNIGITRSSSESQHAMSIIAGESMCSTDDIMEDVEEGNLAPDVGTTNNGRWWLEEHCSRASFQTLRRTNSTIDMDTDSQPFLEGSNTEGTFQDTGYQTGSIHCTNYSLAGHENNSGSTSNYTQTTKSKVPTSTNGSHIPNTGTQVTTNTVILSEFSFPQAWPTQ